MEVQVFDDKTFDKDVGRKFLNDIMIKSGVEEYHEDSEQHFLNLMVTLSVANIVIVKDDEGNGGFCIYDEVSYDPHMIGEGLCMLVTVSNSTACTKAIMKHILDICRERDLDFLHMSHRIAPYTYRCQYHLLRKH